MIFESERRERRPVGKEVCQCDLAPAACFGPAGPKSAAVRQLPQSTPSSLPIHVWELRSVCVFLTALREVALVYVFTHAALCGSFRRKALRLNGHARIGLIYAGERCMLCTQDCKYAVNRLCFCDDTAGEAITGTHGYCIPEVIIIGSYSYSGNDGCLTILSRAR